MNRHAPLFGLAFTVVRIRAGDKKNPNLIHYGTGFFYLVGEGEAQQAGHELHISYLSKKENFVPDKLMDNLHAATPTLMVGFPNGIMDEANNFPVVRRGCLATPYEVNYQGKSDFAVDIAAFGGSSGSPVFAFFEHMIGDAAGNVRVLGGPQVYLIGVLYSGPQMTAQGEIIQVPVPTAHNVQTNVMIHIGYCLKAHLIEELYPVIQGHFAIFGKG